MAKVASLAELLRQSWTAEAAGVGYFDALAQRFAEQAEAMTIFRLVEQTTRDLIEPVARAHGVESIDQEAAARGGAQYADSQGSDWANVLHSICAYCPRG